MICKLLKENYNLQLLIQETNLFNNYIPHKGCPDGWSGISLRNKTGTTSEIGISVEHSINRRRRYIEDCQDTIYLNQLPYISSILKEIEQIPVKIGLVRLLKIKAGHKLPIHSDKAMFNFDKGFLCRLHIPIISSPDVHFIINDKTYILKPGNLYYADVSHKHTVVNHSQQDRIHLVIDVESNQHIKDLINTSKL